MKIEKDVPIPKAETRGRPSKYPFSKMGTGDSIFIDGGYVGCSAYACAMQHARLYGKRFSGRKEGNGLRIWRVE